MIDKPKIYSQFSGFRSHEISSYFNKTINLKNINSYAEIGCPLWGNYDYFKKPWIKQYFINIDEKNFWKADKKISDNCLKYLSRRVKVLTKKNLKQIDFVGIYNFLDHLENPLKFFNKEFKNVRFYGIICEDINLSKKIDCQHFSSWNYKSLMFLSKKMLSIAQNKALKNNLHDIEFIHGDAENLPLENNSVDYLTIAYGFRNIAHHENALLEFHRVLKNGGSLGILEFSIPIS